MKIYAESYGCTLNKSEAGELLRAARGMGHTLTADPSKASVAVLATCVVIDSTERKMLKRLKAFNDAGIPVLMIGCMGAARLDAAIKACPDVHVARPGDVAAALEVINGVAHLPKSGTPKAHGWVTPPRLSSAARPPFCSKGDVICPIPIASGCKGSCTYCITRLARREIASRPVAVITEEIRAVLAAGAREIQLCAQDSAVYGSDIGASLPVLIKGAASLPGEFMMRVGMMNPSSLQPILKDVMEAYRSPKVYKFLHLPVQSGDDDTLARMGRSYSVDGAERQVAAFRGRFPTLSVSTDVIVGFPGETEAAHRRTMAMLRRLKPDIVNVTRFSPRPGTAAERMGGVLRGAVVKGRSRELTDLRFAIAIANNRRFVGELHHVLVTERGKGDTSLARTESYRQVVIKGRLPMGRFVDVDIIGATRIGLMGKPASLAQK